MNIIYGTKIGFIGLGNVGRKLAASLLRNNFNLIVRDLDNRITKKFSDLGALVANNPKELAEKADLIITCLPSPEVCSKVMESEDGVIKGLSKDKIWLEMSKLKFNGSAKLATKKILIIL